ALYGCLGTVLAAVLAAVISGVFLLMKPDPRPPVTTTSQSSSQSSSSSSNVDFTIHDTLGPNQISEQVSVSINGRSVGVLTVNEDYPDASLRVTVTGAGYHSYTVDAQAVFMTETGQVFEASGTGQGTINVRDGSRFTFVAHYSGPTWIVSLEELP
ncbi:MAG: hypothetical protein M3328_08985, partial [Chloroflexota bacterium]|nr:hypothetical protein [Chloroflexota bacterium]